MTFRAPFATALLAIGILLSCRVAAAQTCRSMCMPGESRDEHGCCIAQGFTGAAGANPATPGGADPTVGCVGGQSRTADTAGHCCWAGQVWGGDRCRGIPTSCPTGSTLNAPRETCELAPCASGQTRMADGVTCCFSGQVAPSGTCRGVPNSCPMGMHVAGETCVADPAPPPPVVSNPVATPPPVGCPAGQAQSPLTAGHCCWPDQAWSAGANACIGIPSCPAGLVANGDNCTPPAAPAPPSTDGAESSSLGGTAAPAPPRRRMVISSTGPIILGVGGAAALGGAIFWILSEVNYQDLRTTCTPVCPFSPTGMLSTRVSSRVSDIQLFEFLGDVFLPVGLATATVGAVLTAVLREPADPVQPGVAFNPLNRTVVVGGRFF